MPRVVEHTPAVLDWLVHAAAHEPFLIALDGHSAAGKSTLARALAATLPRCTVVHGDDFYRVLDPEHRASLSAVEGYDQYFDWQRLEAEVLRPLRAGQPARYQAYDWDHNRLGAWQSVAPEGVIIVEGVYSARPELAACYDAIVCVEAPRERRMQVQRQRGDDWAWVERWEAAEVDYIETTRLRERADIVLAFGH